MPRVSTWSEAKEVNPVDFNQPVRRRNYVHPTPPPDIVSTPSGAKDRVQRKFDARECVSDT